MTQSSLREIGLDPSQAYSVLAPKGMKLLVKNQNESIPGKFALAASLADDKVAIRISGGCKHMGPEDKLSMLQFFLIAFDGFKGLIWSGATRAVDAEGNIDPVVTEIPGVVRSQNPLCVALGSAPRVDTLRLMGESRLVLDKYDNVPNPALNAMLLVQKNANDALDWDGDVDDAFDFMADLMSDGGFSQAGIVAWNGGPVTKKEIEKSAARGWPTILVRGSGRETDIYIEKFEAGDAALLSALPKNHLVTIVDRKDPSTLRDALVKFGFIDLPA